MNNKYLIIQGARQNNLKNINLSIPHNKVTVITGISGSGKSSLAFDTIFAEGQWRYIESLSTYTRMFIDKIDRPDVEAIRNIRPAIAIEQKNPVKTSRSTVGTSTEIYDYLRLLFAKIGKIGCPDCGGDVRTYSPADAVNTLMENYAGQKAYILIQLTAVELAFREGSGSISIDVIGCEVLRFDTKFKGTRLRPEALNVRIKKTASGVGVNIHQMCSMPIDDLYRQSKTLSGGESQRINLSNQLGSRLVGTLYVLDEPSIGLHARDTNRLIDTGYSIQGARKGLQTRV